MNRDLDLRLLRRGTLDSSWRPFSEWCWQGNCRWLVTTEPCDVPCHCECHKEAPSDK